MADFLDKKIKNPTQRIICTQVEAGVAKPTLNKETGSNLLITYETGILTQKAPMIP